MPADAGERSGTVDRDEVHVLIRNEPVDGVCVLAVSGHVRAPDAAVLGRAVQDSLGGRLRGVVVDLGRVHDVGPGGLDGLGALAGTAPAWPRPTVVLCGHSPAVLAALDGAVVHADRAEAVRHVDDRSPVPRERIDLGAGLDGPAEARAAVAAACERLGLDDLRDDVALVVSEIVTNAVRHASPPLALEIADEGRRVVIAVVDGSSDLPRPRAAEDDDEGGRGLLLVDLLSVEHGVRPGPPGKTVWAALERPRTADPGPRTGAA